MHVLWLFFAWPAGSTWSNVLAIPGCALVTGVAAFLSRDRLGRALSDWHKRHLGHHVELAEIRAKLEAHADLLDPHTPGGLNAVLDEVRRAVSAAESAREEIRGLGVIAGKAKTPRRGATEMRKTAGGKGEP